MTKSAKRARRRRRRICICGGGSLAHAVAAVVGARDDVALSILTRQPQRWSRRVRGLYLDIAEIDGVIAAVSDDPAIVHGADIVFIAVPSHATEGVLQRIKPFVDARTWVGGLPGFTGFDWRARAILGPEVPLFGLQRVPFVRKTVSYGEVVWISGIRPRLFLATLPSHRRRECAEVLQTLFNIPTEALPTYLAINLSNTNPTFHPARIYAAFRGLGAGETLDHRAQFYEDWDDAASEMFLALDRDLFAIAAALPADLSGVVPILRHYSVADRAGLTAKIRSIRALQDRYLPVLPTPAGWLPDTFSSYFREDVAEGLLSIRGIAEVAQVPTPAMDAVLQWGGDCIGEVLLASGSVVVADGRPLPQRFGLGTPARLVAAST